jgi:thioredoxin-dependent peroxiredoxin
MKFITDDFPLVPKGTLSFPRQRPVLLIFYPADFTPTCTKQLCDYRDNYEEFRALNCDIIGVSKDDEDSHRRMIEAHKLPFPLLSDPKKLLARALGLTGLIPKRGYALIDPEGGVRWQTNDMLPVFFTDTSELIALLKPMLDKMAFSGF